MRLQDHSRRLTQLEAVRNRGCEKESDGNARLIQNLFDRVNLLEDRLNFTLNQNEDLKQEIQSLKANLNNEGNNSNNDNNNSSYDSNNNNRQVPHRVARDLSSSSSDSASSDEAGRRENSLASAGSYRRGDKPVIAFDAFRNQPFYKAQSYLTFNGTTVNVGGAFDPSTGLFTAPVEGVYSFSFHGLTYDGTATHIKIMKNGENVGGAYRRHEGEGDEEHPSLVNPDKAGLKKAEGMLAQSLLLELESGDEVAVYAYHGNLRDGAWHYTHFTGHLLS